jgi:hypothetical protein
VKSQASSRLSSPSTTSRALARDDEKVLLLVLPVVHRHRLAGLEHAHVDPELFEAHAVALEEGELPSRPLDVPARLLRVEHEPALAGGNEPVLPVLERRFGSHR